MSGNDQNRARLVAALWNLKQAFARHKVPGLTFIHLNMVLNDAEYRAEIINRALTSEIAELRKLGHKAAEHNVDGRLLLTREGRELHAASEQPQKGASGFLRRYRLALGGVSFLVVLGLAGAGAGFFVSSQASHDVGAKVERVSGSIGNDTIWRAATAYYLEGTVYVENGTNLRIEPGTRIYGRPGAALVITRGATLHARGTPDAPIVFSGVNPPGTRHRGDWGGVVLLGGAPVNVAGAAIEGMPADDPRGVFGGDDPDWSCGVLEYVRIEFAGYEVYANNELNGLTLGGCGANTVVRNVQVHMALDDGVEVFGGTVDLRNILITRPGDDALDWDLGWRGRAQFIAVQLNRQGDNGFEGDNLGADHNALPRSAPVFHNVTLIGSGDRNAAQRAMTLREGTAGRFNNLLIGDFALEAIDIRDPVTAALAAQNELAFAGVLFFNNGPDGNNGFADETGTRDDDGGFVEAGFFRLHAVGVRTGIDPLLPPTRHSLAGPDLVPLSASAAADGVARAPQDEFWDEGARYLGAFAPGEQAWTRGWTAFPEQ